VHIGTPYSLLTSSGAVTWSNGPTTNSYDELRCSGFGYIYPTAKAFAQSSYCMQAEVRGDATNTYEGLVLRRTNDNNLYRAFIHYNGKTYVSKLEGGVTTNIATSSVTITPTTWNTICAKVDNDSIIVSVNGARVISTSNSFNTPSAPQRVGIFVGGSSSFRNLRIFEADGTGFVLEDFNDDVDVVGNNVRIPERPMAIQQKQGCRDTVFKCSGAVLGAPSTSPYNSDTTMDAFLRRVASHHWAVYMESDAVTASGRVRQITLPKVKKAGKPAHFDLALVCKEECIVG